MNWRELKKHPLYSPTSHSGFKKLLILANDTDASAILKFLNTNASDEFYYYHSLYRLKDGRFGGCYIHNIGFISEKDTTKFMLWQKLKFTDISCKRTV